MVLACQVMGTSQHFQALGLMRVSYYSQPFAALHSGLGEDSWKKLRLGAEETAGVRQNQHPRP